MNDKKLMRKKRKVKKYNPWLEENSTKKFPKKFIASLISVLILLMGMPLTSLVSADETFNGVNYTNVYEVSTENELKTAINTINGSDDGNYAIVFGADIELSHNLELTKNTVTIYGENHTLYSVASYIIAKNGSTLNLGNANYNKTLSIVDTPPQTGNACTPLVTASGTATLNMYSGVTLSGRNGIDTAGGIQLEGNVKFNMYGGKICNCKSQPVVGGVLVAGNSEFTMNDGTIKECNGGTSGGVGVIGDGKFIMNGGTIENCKEDYYKNSYGRSGGVSVSGNGNFTMNDGTIKDCESYSTGGGGVYIYASSSDIQSFEMNGGEIVNCNARGYSESSGLGGGVLIIRGLAHIKDGSKIYNSQANLAGDDIFSYGVRSGEVYTKLKLSDVPEGLILSETNQAIDGWYADGVVDGEDTDRWDKNDLENAQKYTPTPDVTLTTRFALKAAHGAQSECTHPSYTTPTYVWSDDNSTCTATRTCTECGYEETEEGTVTSDIIKEPTCTTPGMKRFTATFTNNAFTTQTKEVEISIDENAHNWEDTWSFNENEHFHVCTYNAQHHCDEAAHIYGDPTYVWSDDNSICTATRTCTECGYEETEQAVTTSEIRNVPNWPYSKEKVYVATFTKEGFEEQTKREYMQCSTDLNGEKINCILQDPKGVLSDDVYLKITPIEKGSDRWNELFEQLDEHTYRIKNLAFFEIELLYKSNDQPVRPIPLKEYVRVLLQIPNGWDKENLEAILVTSGIDGEFEEELVTIDGVNYLAFWANHFSPYAMLDKLNDKGTEILKAKDSAWKADRVTNGTLNSTGESNLDFYIIFSTVLTSCATLVFIFFDKKRRIGS